MVLQSFIAGLAVGSWCVSAGGKPVSVSTRWWQTNHTDQPCTGNFTLEDFDRLDGGCQQDKYGRHQSRQTGETTFMTNYFGGGDEDCTGDTVHREEHTVGECIESPHAWDALPALSWMYFWVYEKDIMVWQSPGEATIVWTRPHGAPKCLFLSDLLLQRVFLTSLLVFSNKQTYMKTLNKHHTWSFEFGRPVTRGHLFSCCLVYQCIVTLRVMRMKKFESFRTYVLKTVDAMKMFLFVEGDKCNLLEVVSELYIVVCLCAESGCEGLVLALLIFVFQLHS